MAKTPAQNTALTRYAACAIRSRKLSAAIALKLNAICDFSRLTVPNQPGGLEAVLLQRILSPFVISYKMLKNIDKIVDLSACALEKCVNLTHRRSHA